MVFEREGLAALRTLERTLSGVQQQVCAEAVLEREALPTLGADVRALACVYAHVRAQVMLHQERLAALFTSVRPLLRQGDGRLVHHRAQQTSLLLLLLRRLLARHTDRGRGGQVHTTAKVNKIDTYYCYILMFEIF